MRRLFLAAQVLAALAIGCESAPSQPSKEAQKEATITEAPKSGKAGMSKRPIRKPREAVRSPNPGVDAKSDR
jgi:hypothetical protein